MATTKKPVSFEQSLSDLEQLVTQMETGELSLDDSLKAFENGVKLTRECQNILDEAEQKVQILSERNGEIVSAPFEEK
jgi:exodeoxyribonuclease VII small subunit